MGLRSTYRRCQFWQNKNNLFRWSLFWSWRVCKQAKLAHLGYRKPARIHWKVDVPKTSHFLVLVLVHKHNWAIFSSKLRKERPLQSMAIVIGPCWTNSYSQKLKRRFNRTAHVPHSQSYTRCFAPCFWRSHYQPHSWCRLATSELQFDTVGLLFVGCRQR